MIKFIAVFFSIFIILIAMAITVYYFEYKNVTVTYDESDTYTINPSKGFFYPVQSYDYEEIENIRKNGMTLVYILFDIEEFKNTEISQEKLKELELCLKQARKFGLKVIMRVAYGFERSSREPEDIELIHQHVLQLEPVLQDYGDLLYVVEAGLLGPWGEWHNSTHGNPPDLQSRLAVIGFWEEVLPEDTFINVRRPSFIRDMYPDAELNENNAFSGIAAARIGWHNDALLSTEDEMGTYPEELTRQDELDWSSLHNLYAPFGGETCCPSSYAKAENTVAEFEQLRISYLNIDYNEDVIENWKNDEYNGENAWDYINKRLGYRFVLESANLREKVSCGGNLNIKLQLFNSGFSSIYYEYQVNFVLVGPDNSKHIYQTDLDVRYWAPGNDIEISKRIKLPDDISEGETCKLGIEIIDMKKSLQDNTKYNIKLSNEDVEYIYGINFFAEYKILDCKFVLIEKD